MDVARQCLEAMAADRHRVECSIKLDYREGCRARLDCKLRSVEQKSGRGPKQWSPPPGPVCGPLLPGGRGAVWRLRFPEI